MTFRANREIIVWEVDDFLINAPVFDIIFIIHEYPLFRDVYLWHTQRVMAFTLHSLTHVFFSSARQQQLISLLCLRFCSVSLFSRKDDKIGALWRSVSLIPAGTRKHIDPTLLTFFLLRSWKFNPNDRWDEETLSGSSSTTKGQKWEICVRSRSTRYD